MKTKALNIQVVVLIGLVAVVSWQERRIRELCVHADAALMELRRLRERNDLYDDRLEYAVMILRIEEMARQDQRTKSQKLSR